MLKHPPKPLLECFNRTSCLHRHLIEPEENLPFVTVTFDSLCANNKMGGFLIERKLYEKKPTTKEYVVTSKSSTLYEPKEVENALQDYFNDTIPPAVLAKFPDKKPQKPKKKLSKQAIDLPNKQ